MSCTSPGMFSPRSTELRSLNPTQPFTDTWRGKLLTIGKAFLATRLLSYPNYHPFVAGALFLSAACLNESSKQASSNIRVIVKAVLAFLVSSALISSCNPFLGSLLSAVILSNLYRYLPTDLDLLVTSANIQTPPRFSNYMNSRSCGISYNADNFRQHSSRQSYGSRADVGGGGGIIPGQPAPFFGTPNSTPLTKNYGRRANVDEASDDLPGQPRELYHGQSLDQFPGQPSTSFYRSSYTI